MKEDDKVDLFSINKYRVKRTHYENRNPIDQITDRFNNIIEDISYRNKRMKVDFKAEFKCDLFRFEEVKDENSNNKLDLLNKQINYAIRIENKNPVEGISSKKQEINKIAGEISNFKLVEDSKNSIFGKPEKKNEIPIFEEKKKEIFTDMNKNIFGANVKEEKKKSENISLNIFSNNNANNQKEETSSKLNQPNSIFGNSGTSLFGNNEPKSLFSNKESNSLFGNNNNNNSNSIFGNSTAANTSNSLFGNQNPQNININLNLPKPKEPTNSTISNNLNKDQAPPQKTDQIPSNNNIQINLPPPNNANPVPSTSNNANSSNNNLSPSKAFQSKLVQMSENYTKMKAEIEKIANNPQYKNKINGIIDNINLRFNQISTDETIQEVINEAVRTLQQLERANDDDLFIYTVDYVCKRIITKAEGYGNEKKINVYRLSRIVFSLDQNVKTFGDYFFSILSFRCPFIIPKIYAKKDCRSEEEYSKKMGFAYVTQNATEHLTDMEAHAYLLFGFLQQDRNLKYKKFVENFVANLFSEACVYPMAAVVNAFIDAFGGVFKEKFGDLFNEFLKKIVEYLKLLETVKNNCKSSDIKAKVNNSIHFIKKNLDAVKKNSPTTMFK